MVAFQYDSEDDSVDECLKNNGRTLLKARHITYDSLPVDSVEARVKLSFQMRQGSQRVRVHHQRDGVMCISSTQSSSSYTQYGAANI